MASSVTNVKVNNSQQQKIKDQMAANSAAWHTADANTKKQLEQANKDLASQLGGLNFDSSSGTWSGTAGGTNGGSNAATSGGNQTTYTDILKSTSQGNNNSGSGSGSSSGQYTKYTGGNAELDAALSKYSTAYKEARAKALAGDESAIMAMQNANEAANQLRNQYGYEAELANDDINNVISQMGKNQNAGLTAGQQQTDLQAPSYADLLNQQQNAYQDLLNKQQSAYDQIQKQQAEAKRAAVEQAISGLTQQKDQVGQSYADLFKQLYIDRRMAEKRLPQQMAAMGYTGGLTESSALGLMTNYANALREGEQERINTLSDLDKAISDTEVQGDISIADLAAQNAKDRLNSYTSIIQAMQDQANANIQYALQQEQYEYAKRQDQLAQDNLDYNRRLAAAQYLFENSGDASGLRELGYTDSQIAALQKQWAAAQATANGAGTTEYKPKLTYNQVMEQINANNITPQVERDYAYWMGDTYIPDEAPVKESAGLKNVSSYVDRIADTANGLSKAYNYILNAVSNGVITETEAQTLLRNYGLA